MTDATSEADFSFAAYHNTTGIQALVMADGLHETCAPFPPGDRDGDPFAFRDEWQTEAVLGLALGIRADEAFDRMPILADALEEAGCDDLLILNHCRYCRQHTPDCWALECVLSNDQEFWTDAVWVAKGQPLPTPAEVEAEAIETARRVKVDRAAGAVVRGCVLLVAAPFVALLLFVLVRAVVIGPPATPLTTHQE